MTSPRLSLRDLFETASDLPLGERARYLDTHCDAQTRARIERMFACKPGPQGALPGIAAGAIVDALADAEVASVPLAGTQIGPFELVGVLGDGGSSTVFHATRTVEGVRQDVALKLLRRGLYSVEAKRQFRRERLALSRLQHPGIARLIEGGVTENGFAYIALELVKGVPITEYARTHRLGAAARLRLFLDVCRAVDAAHRALIVHRDLKPSNVLVTDDGEMKLLDFGIAKLLGEDDETHTQLPAFTPAYASPEQRTDGLITTATDVYALGVLLGELMTGERLSDASGRTPSGSVSDGLDAGVLPAPPAATRRLLKGDLDNIVLKALQVDPALRYASAGTLADDIERLRDGQPVAAHPPSRWYRTRKFVGRHRGGVAVTVAFLLAVLASLGIALWQAHLARAELLRANAMHDFMVSAFVEAEPSVPREGPPRITEVVEQAIAKARGDAHMHGAVRAELLSELGAVLRAQGLLASARETLQWNYDHTLRDFGDRADLVLAAGHELAQTLILTGDYREARTLTDNLLARTPENTAAMRANLLFDSALLASKQHELRRALADSREGLRLTRSLDDTDALARALSEYGNVHLTAGDVLGATSSYMELLTLREREFGPQHLLVAAAHADLSRAYRRAGRLDAAEREIRAALAIDTSVLPKDDWRHANHLNALTMVLLQRRDFRAALDAAVETLRIDRIAHGDAHPETANDLNNVGMLNALLENDAAAVAPLREALSLSVAKFGAEHYETAVTRANYGVALARSGQFEAGESEIQHAIVSLAAGADTDPDEEAATYEKLARLKLDRNDASAALPLIDHIDTLLGTIATPDAYWNGRAATLRATALLDQGQPERARPILAAASAALVGSHNPDPVLLVEVPLLQADAAAKQGQWGDASRLDALGESRLNALRNPPRRLRELAAAAALRAKPP